ncbi:MULTISPECIES: GTP-binding protein [Bosea]|uniref:GTP-binding protein n=1 Tax=Bosea TaxID=85413 RepID=UPI00214F86D0|nr:MULTISPECIES: GTP-binding protein [Bosea]MCR4521995.1 GTP-binding protein [Bosea sp. 47.2.35]MDR6829527.1 GTP-binding protein [Bosea robiniae]MDR6896410.1 GTP-binding protein [Bosea sp. BE109]MDR7139808.1 GTP-binding protein [Bosea sp. BE168]MDR7176470.1 GTP-binding protein [Bosea sp. BE271]
MTTSTTKPYDAEEIEAARKLFEGPWDFVWASTKIDDLPPMIGQEIAFAGRSNVGKSSLINALTRRNALARTSHTPGRTQQLNFFRQVAHEEPTGAVSQGSKRSREKPVPVYSPHAPTIVDMPGYGYAAVGKEKVAAWTRLIHDYLRGRSNLMRVYVLIDARHGIKDVDGAVLETLDKAAVSYQVVLTKGDALKKADQTFMTEATYDEIKRRPAAFPEVLLTSSETGAGLPEFRAAIGRVLAEHG